MVKLKRIVRLGHCCQHSTSGAVEDHDEHIIIYGRMLLLLFLMQLFFTVVAFTRHRTLLRNPYKVMMSVPAELEGQLNPSNSWDVKLILNGIEKIVHIPEDCSMLEAGENIFEEVSSSCRTGICSTCAAQVPCLKE